MQSELRGASLLRPASGLLTALFMTLGLAACGDSSNTGSSGTTGETGSETATEETATGPGPEGVVYHRGNFAEPSSLDPHLIAGTWESHIIRDMFLGLYTDNARGEAVPGAAESYEVSEDGKTWVWTLREGLTWSDGVPVTAEDFVFSYRRVLDPNTAAEYASLLYPIRNAQEVNLGEVAPEELGVRALSEREFEIQLNFPAPYLPEMVTHQALMPVPRHAVEAHGDNWTDPANMVTNGAYKLAEWRPNNYVKLVKNDRFYDAENVAIDTVYFYPTDNSPAAVTRFRNGELDSNNDFPIAQYDFLSQRYPKQTRVHTYLSTNYTIFNTEQAPFDNRNIRMALAMVIDRKVLAEKIMKTGQTPAYKLVPDGIVNYPHTAGFTWKDDTLEKRIEDARALMRAEGYGPDNPLQFVYRHREGVDNQRRAVAITQMWKQAIWVEASLINTETKTHYADLRSGNFEIADAGWVADFNDPKNYLFLFDSRSGQLNYGNYDNPAYDALLDQADNTVDIDERGQVLTEAEQIMLNDAPVIPLLFDTSRNLVGLHLLGFEDNANDYHPTRYMRIDESRRQR